MNDQASGLLSDNYCDFSIEGITMKNGMAYIMHR